MIHIYIVGTAGSGKTYLTHAFNEWCHRQGYDSIAINLDPGVVTLPYEPEVDVREWISIDEIMKDYELGPNGAQVLAADMLALNIKTLEERIGEYRADYLIFDTPGQLELFVFRSTGKVIIDELGRENSILFYLMDPSMATTPASFVSQLMLSATTQFRLNLPLINVLTKKDIVDPSALKMILEWGENPDVLHEDLMIKNPTLFYQLSEGMINVIKETKALTNLIPVSSETWEGMEDLYSMIQHIFYGGEDLERN
ncbi:MAG: ATP/GTP-binding protein [Thermoplasmata archaeon]|nr:ATP/GTP-binding protein [Thermoplasmata archaeon]